MKANSLHSCILLFWALTLMASPLSRLCLPDDNAAIALSSACEEEAGELFKPGADPEILMLPFGLPCFDSWSLGRSAPPAFLTAATKDFVCDVVLPPPKGGLL